MTKNNKTLYYGLTSPLQVRELAKRVVAVLGGSDAVYCILVETSAVETLLGTYPDSHPDKLGVGHCQHDQINLDDLQLHPNHRAWEKIYKEFGYDMAKVKLADLAYDPLLSLICCRLSYMRIAELVPADLLGRAQYWKQYYNTNLGAGSVSEYLERVHICLGDEWQ